MLPNCLPQLGAPADQKRTSYHHLIVRMYINLWYLNRVIPIHTNTLYTWSPSYTIPKNLWTSINKKTTHQNMEATHRRRNLIWGTIDQQILAVSVQLSRWRSPVLVQIFRERAQLLRFFCFPRNENPWLSPSRGLHRVAKGWKGKVLEKKKKYIY